MDTLDNVEELIHFGVKGMKWGRRKSEPAGEVPTSVQTNPSGQIKKVVGGKNAPASEDALRVAAAGQKAKQSGPQSLSTKELQDLVTRMNLEQQYGGLRAKEPNAFKTGLNVIKTIIGVAKTGQEVVNTVQTGKKIFDLAKGAVKAK